MDLKTVTAEISDHGIFLALRVILHLLAACQFSYAVYFFWVHGNFPRGSRMRRKYGGKFSLISKINVVSGQR